MPPHKRLALLLFLCLNLALCLPFRVRFASPRRTTHYRYDRTRSLAAQYDSERLGQTGFKRAAVVKRQIDQPSGSLQHELHDSVLHAPLDEGAFEWRSPLVDLLKSLFGIKTRVATETSATLASTTLTGHRTLRYRPWTHMHISSGWSGRALEEARDAWLGDWNFEDMLAIDGDQLVLLRQMVDAAKTVDGHGFLPAIVETSGSLKGDLQRGQVKNKVLYLFGYCLLARIRLAQLMVSPGGRRAMATRLEALKLADLEAELAEVVARDRASADERSVAVFQGTQVL